ncbi:RNA methyltransferase [Candidatus Woesearchaeota archaeon]|nr:RNA methyltransferase [Candidatus Woesearchaeota archaeon]
MISIILMEPEVPGNIGACARVMKNFDLTSLVLVNPKCDYMTKESLDRASHAKDVLEKAKITDKKYLDKFDVLIGTTAKVGNDYNLRRIPLKPWEIAEPIIMACNDRKKVGIMFGRESHGLSNDELSKCEFNITIPASEKYPVLNLSVSISIVCYELAKARKLSHIEHFPLATGKDKEVILKLVDDIIAQSDYTTTDKEETQRKLWKRLVGKSFLTKREAMALIGFLKKVK